MTEKGWPSSAAVKALLDFDPSTGIFRWKEPRGNVTKGTIAGSNTRGYISIRIDGTLYKAHRLAWLHVYGEWPPEQIDHKNGVGNDNRICNLRIATNRQNQQNSARRRDNTSGLKGVSFFRLSNKWRAEIMINGKRLHLGLFLSAEDAHAAYLAAAEEHFGEFARAS